jgi:hypothetical protein
MMHPGPIHAGTSGRCGKGTRRIMLAICLIVLSRFCTAATPQQDQATLYFLNTSGWKVFPEKLALMDNDKQIAALNREHYVVLHINSGHNVLALRYAPKTLQVDLDATPGVTYYVAGGFYPGISRSPTLWALAEVPKDEADKLLAKMKPQAQK